MTDDNIQKITFRVPDGVDGLTVLGSATAGGTFTLTHRHVTSPAIPFDANAKEIDDACKPLGARDAEITATHLEDPEKYADCWVCFPPPAPPAPVLTFPIKVRRGLSAWWDEVKHRTWAAMEALRGRYY